MDPSASIVFENTVWIAKPVGKIYYYNLDRISLAWRTASLRLTCSLHGTPLVPTDFIAAIIEKRLEDTVGTNGVPCSEQVRRKAAVLQAKDIRSKL